MITLDLPAPPSVNRMRRIDLAAHRLALAWARTADNIVMAQRTRMAAKSIKGPFELHVVIDATRTRMDLDNGLKALIDYLRRIEVIEDDGQKYMRRLVVELGEAPEGCRITLLPWGA